MDKHTVGRTMPVPQGRDTGACGKLHDASFSGSRVRWPIRYAALAVYLWAAASAQAQTPAQQQQDQAMRLMRQQIEAMPLSREEKDLLLQQQTKAMTPKSGREDKWHNAREVRYRIIGVFDGRVPLDATGDARVRDRVQIDFVLDARNWTLKDKVSIRNEVSEVSDPQSKPKGCRVPVLHGKFEFHNLEAVEPLAPGGPLAPYANVRFSRDYPAMTVAAVCTGSRSLAEKKERETRQLMIPMTGQYLQQKSDTITVKELGWTWTYEATPR